MASGVRAVIFDWGGTITPWHHDIDWHEPYRRAGRLVHPDSPDHAAELAERLVAAETEIWRQKGQMSGTIAKVLAACEVTLDGSPSYDDICAAILDFWEPHTHTDPDAAGTLAALKERGLAIGLLSNTFWPREAHDGWLLRDGVLDYFDATTYTSELPWMKPHQRAFLAAMAAVGVDDPAEVVFVGDRPYDDIHGAKSVGMRAVLVPHSRIPEDQRGPVDGAPDGVIERLPDLVPLIDRWRAG